LGKMIGAVQGRTGLPNGEAEGENAEPWQWVVMGNWGGLLNKKKARKGFDFVLVFETQ